MQYELQRKLRRNQGARGLEPNGLPTNLPPAVPPKDRDDYSRARNGSGTTVSDSEDTDSITLASNQSSLPLPSPPQSSAGSSSHHTVLSPGSTTASALSPSAKSAARNPPPNHITALSPIATRVREMDADAMEKYMRRTRSGSQGTSSPNGSQQTTAATIQDDAATLTRRARDLVSTPRKLRSSASAAQLRTSTDSAMSVTTTAEPQTESRTRAGTNPTAIRPTLSPIPMLTRSTTSDSLRSLFTEQDEEDKSYTGPPSQYAQFPGPPAPEDPVPPVNRRKGLHMLLKSSAADAISHRRGMSATSVRGS